jgi:hypothetical protein
MESRCFFHLENALSNFDQFPMKGYYHLPLACLGVGALGTYSQPRRSCRASRSRFTRGTSLSFFTTGTRRTLRPRRALFNEKKKRGE